MTEDNDMGEIIPLSSRQIPAESDDYDDELDVDVYSGDAEDYSFFDDLPDGSDVEASSLFWTGVEIPAEIVERFVYLQQKQYRRDYRLSMRKSSKKRKGINSYHMVPDEYGDHFFRTLGLMRDAMISKDEYVAEEILGLHATVDDYDLEVRIAAKIYNLDVLVPEFFDSSGRLLGDWDSSNLH
jgi:hypothetical protein